MILASITYRLAEIWMKNFSNIRFVGPVSANSPAFDEILRFRLEQNHRSAPHLEDPVQLEIERRLQIDERSLHFSLERNGRIVACVRATPAPYELSELSPKFAEHARGYPGYFEFGRLCTDASLKRRGFYAGILTVKAARVVFMEEDGAGIIAVCRPNRVAYMEKLGLEAGAEAVTVPARRSEYRLMAASRDRLLRYYFKRLWSSVIRSSESPAALENNETTPEGSVHDSRSA